MNMAKPNDPDPTGASEVNAGHLRAFIERIERLEEEKKALAGDIKDVYGEAKANGFDVKIMRKIVSIRRQDRDSRTRGGDGARSLSGRAGDELTVPSAPSLPGLAVSPDGCWRDSDSALPGSEAATGLSSTTIVSQ